MRCRFWFLFLLPLSVEKIAVPIGEVKKESSTATCLTAIGVSLSGSKMAILYSSEYENLTTAILQSVKVPVVINAVERAVYEKMEVVFSNDLVMIFGRYNIGRVLNESLWDAGTRFLLVYEEEKEMEAEFPDFWAYKILNVFGVLSKGQRTVVYSYLPYADGTCGMGKPLVVDECSDGRFVRDGFRLRGTEKFRNLNGCPVNVSVADIQPNVIFKGRCGVDAESDTAGFEANLIGELSRKMNFLAVYRCNPQGAGWIKPSPGGAVGSVYKGESEFALGVLGPSMERFHYMTLSIQYNMDECLIFGVPKGAGLENTTEFDFLIFEFDRWTWLLIAVMFVGLFLFFWVSSFFSLEEWLRNKTEISMMLYSGLMGLAVKNPGLGSYRVSLLCWIIFSLIMTVAYKAAMGSKLTIPSKIPDINTFEGLLRSRLELTGPKSMYRFLFFSDKKDPIIKGMVQRFVTRNFETAPAVHLIATERNIAYLGHKSTFLYYSLIDKAAKGNVHVIKTCLVTYHPSVVIRKKSFFERSINEVIIKLEEAGIGDFWRSEYIYSTKAPPAPFVVLTVDRFYGLFWIVGLGYGLAIFCFVVEVYVGSYSRKNQALSKRVRDNLEGE